MPSKVSDEGKLSRKQLGRLNLKLTSEITRYRMKPIDIALSSYFSGDARGRGIGRILSFCHDGAVLLYSLGRRMEMESS